MTTLREAAQQALEAICGAKLCEINSMSSRREMVRLMDKAITALKAALAEPVQEPVAWMYPDDYAGILKHQSRAEVFQKAWCNPAVCVPLFTAPPQRKTLTEEEIADIYIKWDATPGVSMADFARAIDKARGIE